MDRQTDIVFQVRGQHWLVTFLLLLIKCKHESHIRCNVHPIGDLKPKNLNIAFDFIYVRVLAKMLIWFK